MSYLNSLNLKSINSEMGYKLYPNEESYTEAKAKAYKEEQETRNIINDREHSHAAWLESKSEVLKPLTKKQDNSLKEKRNCLTVKRFNSYQRKRKTETRWINQSKKNQKLKKRKMNRTNQTNKVT